jgi:alkylation response protein AidB-like acyl-CoA dehydrogenase
VSGLRATGSCDFEVQDLFVPEQRTHIFLEHRPTQDGVIYRLPALSVFPWTVSVVPLGIARGAMNAFAKLASEKARMGANALLRDREIVQSNFGRADALYRAARAFLTESMTELAEAVSAQGSRLVPARATFRAACSHAAESAVRIAGMLAAEAGASAIF